MNSHSFCRRPFIRPRARGWVLTPPLQRRPTDVTGPVAVPPVVHDVLCSRGQPLDSATRAFMEPRFGHDFSKVRVHADTKAAESARAVNANAYTVGHEIVFGAGRFAPGTHEGRRLIAHELTHVVQQSNAERIYGEQGNEKLSVSSSISPTMLQKQDAEKGDKDRFLLSMEAKEIAKDCPDFDDEVMSWIYEKAEPFIQSSYKGLNSLVVITSRTTWKTPSTWGELDIDINFTKMSQNSSPEELLGASERPQQHVKLIARFRKFADGLHIVGELIDWLDGHLIVRRSWEGVVKTDRTLGFRGYVCNKTKITDLPEPEPTHRFQKTNEKKRIQAKLTIGASNDPLEQEADRLADQVLAAPLNSAVSGAPPRIQRFSGQSNGQMDAAPASVEQVLASPGRPLEPALRKDMEQRFGHDFSRVRVHSGAAAEQSARDVNAHAYTMGHHIVFGAGRFAPETHLGRRLLAHELTHVVQQSGSGGIRADSSNEKSGLSAISLATTLRNTSDASSPSRTPPPSVSPSGFGLATIEGAAGHRAIPHAARKESGEDMPARSESALNFLSATNQHVIQRQAKNVIRHHGRWGDIDDPTYLKLWAKEAAMTKLWFGSTVRALQEAPGSAPQLVDAVLPKLRAALAGQEEFSGTPEARQDADEVLRDIWPMIREPVIEQLVARYTKQLVQAVGHTPAGTELEMRPDEIDRVRHRPYDQFAFSGYQGDMLRKGQIRGAREILDIKGCPTPKWCSFDPFTEIWFILKRDPTWIYLSNPRLDKFNWHVAGIAREVAESTQMAAELFPFLLKLAGFSLGLSSRLALIVAGEILDVLGEQGTRSARGEPMQSALEVIKSVGLNVFMAHFTGRLFDTSPAGALAADLEQTTERAVVRARREVARTDAALVERELHAGKARAVTDAQLASDGYRLEVDVISEGQAHTWRRKTDGGWCRFTSADLCVGPLSDAVDEAAKLHPPNFERDLAAAGVSAQARKALGQQKLSVNDLVARHPARGEVRTPEWIDVRGAVPRGGDELRIHLASEYGLSDYIRYHIRAPGLGKEGYPIPLAPTWMNHGANRIEGFMRAQRAGGFTVRFKITRATFGGDELRPFFEEMLREGSPATLRRLANDRGRVERFLKEITYDIETYRVVGGRPQREVWRATMVAGLPPAGTRARIELPARVR